jgi:hypothetical protein
VYCAIALATVGGVSLAALGLWVVLEILLDNLKNG